MGFNTAFDSAFDGAFSPRAVSSGSSTAAYRAAVLADSPVLFAPLDEPSGSFADLSANAAVGTGNGSISRAQPSGLAKLGNGVTLAAASTSFVTFPDASYLDITGDVTYEAWINPAGGSGTNRNFMTKGNDGPAGGYGFWVNTANKLLVTNVGSGATLIGPGSTTISVGTMYYVVFTRSVNLYTIYVNAVSDLAFSDPTDTIQATTQPFTIVDWSTLFYGGFITNVAVYNSPLSLARIQAHYTAATT